MFKSVALYGALQGRYLRPYWPLVLLLAVLLFASTALQIVLPQIVRHFIDTAQERGALTSLYMSALTYLALGLGAQFLQAFVLYFGRDVAWRATNRLRSDLTVHVLKLDMGFHGAHRPGELLERIDGDIHRLANFFSQFFIQIVGALLLLAGMVVVTWLEDWRFGLAVLGFAAFFLLAQTQHFRFTTPLWQAESRARADLFGVLGEHVSGNTDIQKSGAASYSMRKFYEANRRDILSLTKALIVSGFFSNLSYSVNSLRISVGLVVGAYLFQRGDISIGTVYLVLHYLLILGMPVLTINRQLRDLQMAAASILRVKELMDTRSRVRDGHGATLPPGQLPVEFNGVSFSYTPGVTVLRELSFRLEAGRTLGLLGRTGSGKTTMSRLLFRFYDPNEGSVRLGETDIRELRLEDLRKRVGLVTQEVQLFQATVWDNLTLFDPAITDDAVIGTLESLGLGDWYRTLPNGLDSEISAGGGQLSAGESQLLAFARVFLRNPDCVILDEASSRLDPATEALLQKAVDRLLEGRTALVIAHRLATVERVDEIVVIDNGRILEHGERDALAGDPSSHYSRLLKTGLEEALA